MRTRSWAVVLFASVVALSSCSGHHQAEPTLPTVDFTPRLVVTVDDAGFHVALGETSDPAITADPPSAPEGTVVEVRNAGTGPNRVSDDSTIDTGIMQPGDSTTIVLTSAGPLELHDAGGGETLSIDVTARST